jgi:hypothetical protein
VTGAYLWTISVPIPGEPGAHRDIPIGISATPAPDDVPGLSSTHFDQSWLLGLQPPPLGPTRQEKRLFQRAWHAILDLEPIILFPV